VTTGGYARTQVVSEKFAHLSPNWERFFGFCNADFITALRVAAMSHGGDLSGYRCCTARVTASHQIRSCRAPRSGIAGPEMGATGPPLAQ
jgi:hypothetical protein